MTHDEFIANANDIEAPVASLIGEANDIRREAALMVM